MMAEIKTRKEINITYNIDEVKMIEIEIERLLGIGYDVLEQYHPTMNEDGRVELIFKSEKTINV